MKNLRIIIIFFTSILVLSSCVPAALVVGATAGGAVIYDKRGVKTKMNDNAISQNIYATLRQDKDFGEDARLSIAVFNGIVLLLGEVPNSGLSDQAFAVASDTKGVRRVFNQIHVGPVAPLKVRSYSSLITAQVKTAMLATSGLRSTQIKVVTNNQVVYLMGVVSHKQANLATNTARQVTGVKKVVKVFEYEK